MLAGWNLAIKNGASVSYLPADRWPWHWTYALVLERRWEYIGEMSAAYGDEDAAGDDKEIPPEIWHDRKRVDEWIDRMKAKRKEKNTGGGFM
jgi:hypothetical protein